MFHVKQRIKTSCFLEYWLQILSRRQMKVFWSNNFFKMLARCGRAAHVCEANRNCTINENKNLRENRKESQLPFKSGGCNERYGFRGNCDSQGKLGMCPSLAEPDLSGVPRTSRRQPKVFWSSNFSKMLARFRASSPDRCPQAAKFLCHAFGTRRGWWEKRQLFEAGRTRPQCH